MSRVRTIGIDGCRGGWVLSEANDNLDSFAFSITEDLEPLFDGAGPDCLIAIDIPIGLPEEESRECDKEARRELGRLRGSSVFPTPARDALKARTYSEAQQFNLKALGVGMSQQTFHIMAKIQDVDDIINAERQKYIRESHPELTFARLNGAPMVHNKKSPSGRAERFGVLQNSGLSISDTRLSQERQRLGLGLVELDDLLDALACLITAWHIRQGRIQSVGHPRQMDRKGLLMEIVTCMAAAKDAPA